MKKFLVLYKASTADFELARNAGPEQQKAGMAAWMSWSQRAGSTIVDLGSPLGKGMLVTKSSARPVSNELGGYSILQSESAEALAESLKGHPHFMMDSGTVEIVEIMPMPGA